MAPWILFWDIDGTLLSTARAGVRALEAAAREAYGVDVDLDALPTGGLTDGEIAAAIAADAGLEASDESVARFLDAYGRALPAALHTRQGTVLPSVREILEDLAGDERVVSLLLTGNTRPGAAAKLAHYGLDDLLGDGAFCPDARPRAEIARQALALARERVGDLDLDRAFVIGDTPHDIACADAIGVRTLAVATGTYDAAALERAGGWRVLEQLPPPQEFRRIVGIA